MKFLSIAKTSGVLVAATVSTTIAQMRSWAPLSVIDLTDGTGWFDEEDLL